MLLPYFSVVQTARALTQVHKLNYEVVVLGCFEIFVQPISVDPENVQLPLRQSRLKPDHSQHISYNVLNKPWL